MPHSPTLEIGVVLPFTFKICLKMDMSNNIEM
jgi:hypothetical protein